MAREHPHTEHKPPPGVHDISPGSPSAHQHGKGAFAVTGFWRIRIWVPASPEPGAPDHVVAARDEIEAEAHCYQELGIRSVDKSTNQVEITPASEAAYITAQARRLKVDLRSSHDQGGKLTWAPEGHKLSKDYWVSEFGEVLDKKPEE
jgi:hypothetical protein